MGVRLPQVRKFIQLPLIKLAPATGVAEDIRRVGSTSSPLLPHSVAREDSWTARFLERVRISDWFTAAAERADGARGPSPPGAGRPQALS